MSVATQTVKKFINDPEDVVPEALAGIAAAHPDLVRVDFEQPARHPGRRARAGQGRPGLGRRLGPRAAARRIRRRRHARRGLRRARSSPRRCPTRWRRRRRPSTAAPACCTSSRTTPATCSTSSWRPSWPRTTASRSRAVVINDDVAVQDSPLHRRAPRRRRDRAGREDRRRARRGRRLARPRSPTSCRRVNEQGPLVRRGADARARRPAAGTPIFELGADEIEVGVGIHGEPGRRREQAAAPPTRSPR